MTAFLALLFFLLISLTASIMDAASIQSAKSFRRADTNRAIESVFAEYQQDLLDEFDIFTLDATYETGLFSLSNVTDRISYYGGASVDHEVKRVQLLTDDGGRAFLEQVAAFMGEDKLPDFLGGGPDYAGDETHSEQLGELEETLSGKLNGLLGEQDAALPETGNPLPNMRSLASTPLTELAMPKDTEVSEKDISSQSLVSERELKKGFGDFSDVSGQREAGKIAYAEYVMSHFPSAADEAEEPDIEILSEERALDYQVEYIFCGKRRDAENLEGVLKALLLLRYAPNYAYLRGSAAKQAEAEALAVTLSTAALVPEAAEVLKEILLIFWAFGESVMDLRSLLAGHRAALTKNDESWQLSISGLLTLGTEEDRKEGMDAEGGLTYEEYLRILFFLHHKTEMAMRTLDLIELFMQKEKGYGWFRADACISKLEITSTVSLRRGITYRFSTYYGYR